MIEWWRSWHGAPIDPKWGVIARIANAPRAVVVALAWAMLDAASKAPVRGNVSGADPEELAVALDVPPEQIIAIMAAMRAANPTTGKPRFIGADGHIAEWARYQPKREDDRDHSSRRRAGKDAGDCGSDVGGCGNTVGTVREDAGTGSPPAPPLESRLSESPPLTPPPGAADRIRMLVWSKSGLSEQAIQTKLVSADSNGLRQVLAWFRLGLSEDRIAAAISRAFAEASEPIRRPWPYLDAVLKTEAEKGADAPAGSAGGFVSTFVDWRKRLGDFRACGFWMDGWGDRPGNIRCEAPADLLTEFGFGGCA